MRCIKAREFLSLEMDGVMPQDAAVELEKHLAGCGDCREYRSDLSLGSRLLAATEPELPDNFDWKLQLRLNQTLKQAAADVAYPWDEGARDRWAWLRNFGAAAAVGMAGVLALAIFFGPTGDVSERPLATGAGTAATEISDRLPLRQSPNWTALQRRGLRQQPVSGLAGMPIGTRSRVDTGWSGSNPGDLLIINRLRTENSRLTEALIKAQWQMRQMQAQLDTSGRKGLDLDE